MQMGFIYRTSANPAMAMAPTPAILPLTLGAAAPVNEDGAGVVATGAEETGATDVGATVGLTT